MDISGHSAPCLEAQFGAVALPRFSWLLNFNISPRQLGAEHGRLLEPLPELVGMDLSFAGDVTLAVSAPRLPYKADGSAQLHLKPRTGCSCVSGGPGCSSIKISAMISFLAGDVFAEWLLLGQPRRRGLVACACGGAVKGLHVFVTHSGRLGRRSLSCFRRICPRRYPLNRFSRWESVGPWLTDDSPSLNT